VSTFLDSLLTSIHPSPLSQTAVLQVLKKAGRPSERSGELREELRRQQAHQCHSEAALNGGPAEPSGLMEAQEEAEYEAAVGEATRGVQDAVTEINEKLEEIKYELADLEEPGEVGEAPIESLEPGVG
jgi:archaellum component FlaC